MDTLAESFKKAWIPISEAAKIIGVSRQRVHQLIKEYDLETDPINARFKSMRRADAERLRDMDRPNGTRRDYREGAAI